MCLDALRWITAKSYCLQTRQDLSVAAKKQLFQFSDALGAAYVHLEGDP